MSLHSQFPRTSFSLVRISNKNTFSKAEITERRIDVCPKASLRGGASSCRAHNLTEWRCKQRSYVTKFAPHKALKLIA